MRSIFGVGRGRWWRLPYLLALTYVIVVVAFNAVLLAAVGIAQIVADDPRVSGARFPDVRHLRPVDDKLWFGAQPGREQYRALAEMGIALVVELRTGVPEDPRDDEPAFLHTLGVDYEWLPFRDGEAPDHRTVERFVDMVQDAPGPVFAHSGGGVGRDVALAAAYTASLGGDPSLMNSLAIGPPTLEQVVYIVAADPADPAPDLGPVEAFSRLIVDGPRIAVSWLRARVSL